MSDVEPRGAAPVHDPDPTGTPELPTESETQVEGRKASLWADAWRQLRRNPIFLISAGFILLFIVMAIRPQLFTSADPFACSLSNSLIRPNADQWFGYDLQGCDYYARTIYGARISVMIGLLVTTFAVLIAVTWGSIAGYYGGWTDTIVARITDVWFAIPTILGAIVILQPLRNATILGIEFQGQGLFQVSLALIILGWPTMLRLMRSQVLATKEADYVEAARALGASDFRIITRHILPNAIAPVIVYATITIGVIIAAEAALSFLGVGLQLPNISWGLMINVAQRRILTAPHLLLFPAIFLSITVFSFILMGDALRDALDPKLR